MEPLELYVLPGCPYCRRVTLVLDRMELPYTTHTVPSAHSRRDTVSRISGQTGVPVLVDPNTGISGMSESTDIVAYLEESYEYPAGVDPNPGLVARLRSLFA